MGGKNMATVPTAIVVGIADVEDDPASPGVNFIITTEVKLLFMGPVPLEQFIDTTIPNTSTKTQIRTLVNAAIIQAAADLGFALTTSRILTVNDVAG
jgi:hypothetical protein